MANKLEKLLQTNSHIAIVLEFSRDPKLISLHLPYTLTKSERMEIHQVCEILGLHSVSTGPENHRVMTIKKEPSMEITDEDRKQLIKDFHLPIPIYTPTEFDYFINLYQDIYNTKDKYRLLLDALSTLNKTNTKLRAHNQNVMNTIVSAINDTPGYNQLMEMSINELDDILYKGDAVSTFKFPAHNIDIYKSISSQIDIAYFISIDIIKANFNALKYLDPGIVLNAPTWEDLMKKYTNLQYCIQSKIFRQILFNTLGCDKKISSIQKYILYTIYTKISPKCEIIGRCGSDELIVKSNASDIMTTYQLITETILELPLEIHSILRITPYCLDRLGNSMCFIKHHLNGPQIEVKNIELDFHAQAYKKYIGSEVTESDRKSMKNDMVITYDNNYIF